MSKQDVRITGIIEVGDLALEPVSPETYCAPSADTPIGTHLGNGEGRLGKEHRPVCPICRAEMVALRMENHDGSGWVYGWACQCNAEMRDG